MGKQGLAEAASRVAIGNPIFVSEARDLKAIFQKHLWPASRQLVMPRLPKNYLPKPRLRRLLPYPYGKQRIPYLTTLVVAKRLGKRDE